MAHGVADQFLLIVVIIGNRGPTVTGAIAAEYRTDAHPDTQLLQVGVEVAQGCLITTISTNTRTFDKGNR